MELRSIASLASLRSRSTLSRDKQQKTSSGLHSSQTSLLSLRKVRIKPEPLLNCNYPIFKRSIKEFILFNFFDVECDSRKLARAAYPTPVKDRYGWFQQT
jgi:hypothetical protein